MALAATALALTLALGAAEPRDSTRAAADSTGPRDAGAPTADAGRARSMARASAAKPNLARGARRAAAPAVDPRVDPTLHPDWAPGRVVLPAPTFRRLTGGRLVADSVVVLKGARKMTLFYRGDSVASYWVALGRNPVGAKERRGDGRTPEGVYRIVARNPKSKFHLSLRVSYPSAVDLQRAARKGVSTGGDIMIHGLPPAFSYFGAQHRAWDWTEGCIAVTDREIEEIYNAVKLGAAIEIRP